MVASSYPLPANINDLNEQFDIQERGSPRSALDCMHDLSVEEARERMFSADALVISSSDLTRVTKSEETDLDSFGKARSMIKVRYPYQGWAWNSLPIMIQMTISTAENDFSPEVAESLLHQVEQSTLSRALVELRRSCIAQVEGGKHRPGRAFRYQEK